MVVKNIVIPVVPLPGSEGWENAYTVASLLEKQFPGQDVSDLCYAMEYNGYGPAQYNEMVSLVLEQQGERDGDSWRWRVGFDDGSTWIAEGSCDYTGWDCQSSLYWTRVF